VIACTCGSVIVPGGSDVQVVNGCGKCGLGVQDDGGAAWEARSLSGLSFSAALDALKAGERVARSGWNGKGMFVVLQRGYPDGIPINANTAEATGLPVGTVCRFLPYLMMRTVDGSFVPWLISQTDALADDWTVLP
jgi:hypothetical protein